MKPPNNVLEVQRLMGQLAALSRFITRSVERSLPFFKALRGSDPFHWTEEQQQAFRKLKQYLEHPEVLTSPTPSAPLLLYIAAVEGAVSMVLVEECSRGRGGRVGPGVLHF